MVFGLNKRGRFKWYSWVFLLVVIALVIFLLIKFFPSFFLKLNSLIPKKESIFSNTFVDLIKTSFQKGDLPLFANGLSQAFGFQETFGDFLLSFFIGLFAGFLLWSFYNLATIFESKGYVNGNSGFFKQLLSSGLKGSWIEEISDKFWKPFIIGIGYAVLMQIPFLNSFIDIITFRFLFVPWFVRAVLIAFYFGVLPTLYWGYRRFKLIKYYQSKLLLKKYEADALRQFTK